MYRLLLTLILFRKKYSGHVLQNRNKDRDIKNNGRKQTNSLPSSPGSDEGIIPILISCFSSTVLFDLFVLFPFDMQLAKDFVNELNEVAESSPSMMQMKMIMKIISIIKQHNFKDTKVHTKHIFTKKSRTSKKIWRFL